MDKYKEVEKTRKEAYHEPLLVKHQPLSDITAGYTKVDTESPVQKTYSEED